MIIKTTNYHIEVSKHLVNSHGHIEHVLYGDERGGMITIENYCLVDYEGFYEMPDEILDALEEEGFNVEDARV